MCLFIPVFVTSAVCTDVFSLNLSSSLDMDELGKFWGLTTQRGYVRWLEAYRVGFGIVYITVYLE